jgi:hypothetical protein
MVIRIDRFVSGNWGRLADDVLCLATIAFIFAIVFGIVPFSDVPEPIRRTPARPTGGLPDPFWDNRHLRRSKRGRLLQPVPTVRNIRRLVKCLKPNLCHKTELRVRPY